MDLLKACGVFVSVSERGSVTVGAAARGMQQSAASRILQGLEVFLGADLFDRSGRSMTLTPFGREVLPAAQRLVQLGDAFLADVESSRSQPFRLALPVSSRTRDLAVLDAEMRQNGVAVDFVAGTPSERLRALENGAARAAVASVPASSATWTVELGIGASHGLERPVALRELRGGRYSSRDSLNGRRLRFLAEDDVPHVRDLLIQEATRVALLPGQCISTGSPAAAVSGVLSDGDVLLCSKDEAVTFGLVWHSLHSPTLLRGYNLVAENTVETEAITSRYFDAIAACLGSATARQEE